MGRKNLFARHFIADHLLLNIFSKCRFEQKFRVSQVCHRWKNLVYEPGMWNNIEVCLKVEDLQNNAVINSVLRRGFTRASIVDRFPYSDKKSYKGLNSFVHRLFMRVPALDTLHLDEIELTEKQMSELFIFDAPNLKDVSISIKHLKYNKSLMPFVTHCKNVERLKVGEWRGCYTDIMPKHFRKLLGNLKKLQYLDIGRCTHIASSELDTLKKGFPELQGLCLNTCPQIRDREVHYITYWFNKLTILRLSGSSMTDEGVIHIARMTTLKQLTLRCCKWITPDGINVLTTTTSPISVLNLSCSDSRQALLEDKALAYIGKSQFHLKSLDVSGWKITDDGLEKFASYNPKVVKLTMSKYRTLKITDNMLKYITKKIPSLQEINTDWNGM